MIETVRPDAADLRATAVEFGLTTAFMAVIFSIIRWGAAGTGAGPWLRTAVVSALIALVIVVFATSRPGRFSGAHMNPAITLGLYAFGSVPARRVLPYLAVQVAGSIAAAGLTGRLWGAARTTVAQPAAGWTAPVVAVAEAGTLALIMAVMCWIATRRPGWPLVWIVGGLFGVQGAALGTLTGASANPARQLGPALIAGETHLLGVYLLAPIAGAVLAGYAARRITANRAASGPTRERRPRAVPGPPVRPGPLVRHATREPSGSLASWRPARPGRRRAWPAGAGGEG